MSGKSRIATIVAFCAVLIPGSIVSAATLSGRAYEGNVGDESHELPGVTVSLYGAPEAGGPRTHIVTQTTAANGWYGLPVAEGFEHYYIIAESGPDPTYTFEVATSVGGTASGNEIHYSTVDAPLDDQVQTGNKFWYKKEGQEPPENRPPVANDDSASTPQDTAVDIDVLANDTDPDDDPLHVNSATDPPHGSTTNHGTHVTYTPEPGFTGTDTFDYTAGDGKGGTGMASVMVTVEGGGEPPAGTGTIRGTKFNDLNGYGQRDPGEPGLPGWQIILQDSDGNVLAAATTDANGDYAFTGLGPGAYEVDEVPQAGWHQTYPEIDGGPAVWVIGLEPEAVVEEIDFGNHQDGAPGGTGEIHGRKWNDRDGQGDPDEDEEGLPGWRIFAELEEAANGQWEPGEPFAITDDLGNYVITELSEGMYRVSEEGQGGWAPTFPREKHYSGVMLTEGQVLLDLDFGNHQDGAPGKTGEIRGRKWNDRDGQGDPDQDEEGLPGWRIFAEPAEAADGQWEPGEPFAITDDLGYYFIADLSPGTYQVSEENKQGWFQSFPSEKHYSGVMLNEGQVLLDLDFGNHRTDEPGETGEIHGRKWNDRDGQGDPDDDEEGLGGWRIFAELEEGANGQWEPGEPYAITDDLGRYVIEGLSPGAYRVSEEGQGGWEPTFPPEKHYSGVMLSQGQVLMDHDFGNHRTDEPGGEYDFGDAPDSYKTHRNSGGPYHDIGKAHLGHTVDPETDGKPGPLADGDDNDTTDDEDGVIFWFDLEVGQFSTLLVDVNAPMNVPVAVAGWIDYDQSGTFEDSTERFININYTGFGVPIGLTETIQVPSDARVGWTYARFRIYRTEFGVDILPSPVGPAGEGEVEDYRVEIKPAGDQPPSGHLITGIKFNDLDGDGMWEPGQGEPGLPGWTIWLDENNDGIPDQTTQTNNHGGFDFSGVSAGTYTVGEEPQQGWIQTSPPAPGTYTFTIPGGPLPTAHFMVFGNTGGPSSRMGEIRGTKFSDVNGNGQRDALEPGMSGWHVFADINGNDHLDAGEPEAYTNANGDYFLKNLLPGFYRVGEFIQYPWQQTFPTLNSNPTWWPVQVQAGQIYSNKDFGNHLPSIVLEGYDFGDAPDKYRTYHNSGGPYHDIGNVHLGSVVDSEGDGQPTNAADGDDAGADDEDGVFPSFSWYSGGSGSVTIDLTGPAGKHATVAGWIDFNRNGNWDSGEQVVSGVYTCTGVVQSLPFTFSVPSVGSGPVYARFRVYMGGIVSISPYGYGGVGEVEDYRFYVLSDAPGPDGEYDFGDAPDSYRTLHDSGGPYHDVGPVRMGSGVDAEFNGQPGPLADADSDDGVSFPLGLQVDQFATVLVNVNAPTGVPVAVTGWIDYDHSDTFEDPAERFVTMNYTGAGVPVALTETIKVPSGTVPGWTYTRFRIFRTEVGVDVLPLPTAYGGEGEVEDYRVEIQPKGDVPAAGHLITGIKFNDLDGSGTWEPGNGELGLPGWTIWLDTNGDGKPDQATTTDSSGRFEFPPVAPGTYTMGEQPLAGWVQTAPGGSGTYTTTVPGGPVPTISFSMFGNTEIDLPTGQVDFGDAPVSYGSAWHTLNDNLTMGSKIDAESSPKYSSDATGDDTHQANDEDGVTLVTSLKRGGAAAVCVEIHNDDPSPAAVIVAGWIDFDGDGQWDPLSEEIGIRPVHVPPYGVVNEYWSFTVPQNAGSGNTFARFRLYRDDPKAMAIPFAVLPTGDGGEGEVEDYRVEIEPEAAAPPDGSLIMGIKFNDLNGNGVWEPSKGELRLPGWTIWLDENNDGKPDKTTKTNSLGGFEFAGVGPGTYTIGEQQQSGWTQTAPGGPGTYATIVPGGPLPSAHFMMFGNTQIDFPAGEVDFGDAPDPTYPTLFVNNGARHIIDPDVFLGSDVDSDPDGQPDSGAQGDDNDGSDDEDGVNFLSPCVQGTAAGVEIIASVPGVLNAWIDFNGNGDWGDADDHVFIDQPVGAGSNVLPVNVPATAKAGTTFARFRFSTRGGLSYEGEANDGEVEDYPVEIEVLTSAIGGFVWNDKNSNRGRDFGEPGIAGVTLDLLDLNGNVLFTTVTTGNGHYDFSNLPAGAYMVDVTDTGSVLSGFMLTTANDPASVTLAQGQMLNVHFGYHQQIATMDFGDAPDPSYPTLLESNGARHVVVMRTYLGSGVDAELNGKPDPGAQGDDNADTDDEDGISGLPSKLIPGDKPTVTVKASVNGYLNAWIDFNRDGDWADPGEQIFSNQAISFGVSNLSFSVPTDTEPGPTLARFRYNTTGGLSFDGLADDGEVEDYAVEIGELRWDFGDAPESYSTTRASNGARHPIVTGVYMGAGIDDEIDGQDSADAQGDDNDGSDDEDGANFKWRILPGGLSAVEVTVSTDGALYGYIDFNRDGDFDDPDDYIFSGAVVSAGPNERAFKVPSSAVVGPTFARLRFSTQVVMSYDGEAKDGEVEDYVVEIEAPGDMDFGDAPEPYPTTMALNGARHVVTPGVYLGSDVDADVDGQPDPTAMGDDIDGSDDDDGVVFKTALIKGNTAHITVTASTKGYLYVWADFNIDGDWEDPDEDIFDAEVLSAGPNSLTFDVPSGATAGLTYIRFRFIDISDAFDTSYNGLSHNGEVEDYGVEIGASTPFAKLCGDANHDGVVDMSDAIYILTYLYLGGPPPWCGSPYCCADTNGDGSLDIQDAIALLKEIHLGVALPPNACCRGPAVQVTVPTIAVPVSLADVIGQAGSELILPITAGDTIGLGITAAAMHLTYDPDILIPVGVAVEGTVASGWDVAYETGATGAGGAGRAAVTIQDAGEGHIVIALAGSRELSGPGTLVNVIFIVSADVPEGQASPIQLADVSFSSGDPVEVNAHAEFVVGEPHEPPLQPRIKWSQPPIEIDPNLDAPPVFCGWGEVSTSAQDLGGRRSWSMKVDDFHCLGPIPVTRIRWWGSYKAWESPELSAVLPDHWRICFWANGPDEWPEDALLPEGLVHILEVTPERVRVEPAGLSEFPDARSEMCFAYDVRLEPHEFFHQAEFPADEQVFWISITAVYPQGALRQNQWRWMTRPSVWGRSAEGFVLYDEGPDAQPSLFPGIFSPVFRASPCDRDGGYDLCFELLTEDPWVKWDQAFTGIRDWPHYEDVESQGMSIRQNESIGCVVADDWLCERNTPVVAAAWWGSYIGSGYEACDCEQNLPLSRPDYFLLLIRADEPPNDMAPYSHPGEVIWEYRAYDYDEVLVGYDRHPEGEPNEPVFRYSVRLPEDSWFRQEGAGGLYWFSVTAVYTDPLPPILYPWGWTSHRHMFGSPALTADGDPEPVPTWQEPPDAATWPADMSFTLYTVPQGPLEGAQELAEYVRDAFLDGAFTGQTLWMTPGPLDETFVARDTDPAVPDLPFPDDGLWWLVMIDDHPVANWGHAVRWIFVKEDLSQSSDAYDRQFFPGVYADFGRGERVPFFHVDLPLEGLGLYLDDFPIEVPQTEVEPVNDCLHAVLISGGIDAASNRNRYAQNLSSMYRRLRICGAQPENIWVYYADGAALDLDNADGDNNNNTGDDVTDWVNKNTIRNRIQNLRDNLDPSRDILLIVTSNHGTDNRGLCLWDFNNNTTQENNEIYTPSELAADTANAQVLRLFMILDQCFSGEFLSIATDGKHANSAVYVAATASEPSYGRQYMELWEQSNPKTTTMNAMHPTSLVPPLPPPSICIKLPCTSTPGMAEGTTGNGDMSLCACTFN